jgi:hypothetical protein
MVPAVSWEPLVNISPIPPIIGDPPAGWNFYPNDGGPTRLFNNSVVLSLRADTGDGISRQGFS